MRCLTMEIISKQTNDPDDVSLIFLPSHFGKKSYNIQSIWTVYIPYNTKKRKKKNRKHKQNTKQKQTKKKKYKRNKKTNKKSNNNKKKITIKVNLYKVKDQILFKKLRLYYTQRKKLSTPMFVWNDKWYDKFHEITDEIISRTQWWPVRTLHWL